MSPALPAGLTLDTATGAISGTPLALQPSQTYTITASASDGTVRATTITLAIDAASQTTSPTAPVPGSATAPERLAASSSDPTDGPLVFTRGAYFPDERMDLCKQVVGPDHIEKLCDAVGHPFAAGGAPRWGRVRHFLLGNNIA